MNAKKYDVDDTDGSNVLGGSVEHDNVYISLYPVRLKGEPTISSLAVGQSTLCRYHLSMRPPVIYRVVRVA